MASRGLLNIDCEEDGFFYSANVNTNWFIEGLLDEYSEKLLNKASLVEERFREMSDADLKEFINLNIGSWGREYSDFFPYKNEVL